MAIDNDNVPALLSALRRSQMTAYHSSECTMSPDPMAKGCKGDGCAQVMGVQSNAPARYVSVPWPRCGVRTPLLCHDQYPLSTGTRENPTEYPLSTS